MKRLFADRPGWKRILQKRFYCSYLNTPAFSGYVSLLCLDKVREPLWTKKSSQPICIVDNGYAWLQHFPPNEHFSMTTMFDANGQIVQWYIDICLRQGTKNNIPWLDDLFLDIVIFPNGEASLLDIDELEQAMKTGEISKPEYNLAFSESKKLLSAIADNKFTLFDLCESHRLLLLQTGQLA